MDHRLPGWNFDENFLLSTQKKSFPPEDELVELLWRDGQLVLQSQTHTRSTTPFSNTTLIKEPTQLPIHQHQRTLKPNESSCDDDTFLEDQETLSWLQYPPDDHPFEKEFSSNFFSAVPPLDTIQPKKPSKQLEQEETPRFCERPPPRLAPLDSKAVNFGDLAKESSAVTVGPSLCGSNLLQNDVNFTTATTTNTTGLSVGSLRDNGGKEVYMSYRCKNYDTIDPNVTSSSGGSSGCSFGRNSKEASAGGTISGHKRKEITGTEEAMSQSGAAGNKSIERCRSTRRSRVAEVHNLSERRRRDRINEKMRALQELIPHCSKTDKASILDEAIDYLKSLQLQLQVMWMGSGMATMMFNGIQPFIPCMGMQMLPPIQNPMNLSGLPILDPSMAQNPGMVCQNLALDPVKFHNQPQNSIFSEELARYIGGFPQMQAASQPMNMMMRFGSQQNHVSAPATGQPVTGGEAPADTMIDNLPSSKNK